MGWNEEEPREGRKERWKASGRKKLRKKRRKGERKKNKASRTNVVTRGGR